MPKKDFSQIAFDVVQKATGEKAKTPAPTPRQVAGRKSGAKGGAKRMDSMTQEERRELALKAAGARWNENTPTPPGAGARKR